MMLPILISVSPAPGSYVFCANAAEIVIVASVANAAKHSPTLQHRGIVCSPHDLILPRLSQFAPARASAGSFASAKRHCWPPGFVIDASDWNLPTSRIAGLGLLPSMSRTAPRHPRLGAAGFHAVEWLATRLFAMAGFHRLGSAFADERLTQVREKLARGETVFL